MTSTISPVSESEISEITPEDARNLSSEDFTRWLDAAKNKVRQDTLAEAIAALNFHADTTARRRIETAWSTGKVSGIESAVTVLSRL